MTMSFFRIFQSLSTLFNALKDNEEHPGASITCNSYVRLRAAQLLGNVKAETLAVLPREEGQRFTKFSRDFLNVIDNVENSVEQLLYACEMNHHGHSGYSDAPDKHQKVLDNLGVLIDVVEAHHHEDLTVCHEHLKNLPSFDDLSSAPGKTLDDPKWDPDNSRDNFDPDSAAVKREALINIFEE